MEYHRRRYSDFKDAAACEIVSSPTCQDCTNDSEDMQRIRLLDVAAEWGEDIGFVSKLTNEALLLCRCMAGLGTLHRSWKESPTIRLFCKGKRMSSERRTALLDTVYLMAITVW